MFEERLGPRAPYAVADFQDAQGAERKWYNEDPELGSMSGVSQIGVDRASPKNSDSLRRDCEMTTGRLGDLATWHRQPNTPRPSTFGLLLRSHIESPQC